MIEDQSDAAAVEFELDSVPHIIVDRFLVPIRLVFGERELQFRVLDLQREAFIQRVRTAGPENDAVRVASAELELDLEFVSRVAALERVALEGLAAEPLPVHDVELRK